jgi:hypothetical protein
MLSKPSQTKAPTGRTALGGISLLMVVAFAVQASADLTTPASQLVSGQRTVLRHVAEAIVRHVERRTCQQDERPVAAAVAYLSPAAPTLLAISEAHLDVRLAPRRLLVLMTSLPPPVA